jgi:hypothetical protein
VVVIEASSSGIQILYKALLRTLCFDPAVLKEMEEQGIYMSFQRAISFILYQYSFA